MRSATVEWAGDVYVYTPPQWTPLLVAAAAVASLTGLAALVSIGQQWRAYELTMVEQRQANWLWDREDLRAQRRRERLEDIMADEKAEDASAADRGEGVA